MGYLGPQAGGLAGGRCIKSITGCTGRRCGGWRLGHLVRPPAKRRYHKGKIFCVWVEQTPQTGRLWVVYGVKEGEKTVRGKIKPTGCVINHGV